MDENTEKKADVNEAEFVDVKEDASSVKDCSKKECCAKKNTRKNGEMSVFVLGIISLVSSVWNPIFALLGFILGIIAVVKGHKARKCEEVPGFATAGWIMGIIALVVSGATLLFCLCTIASLASFIHPYFYYRTFWF